jgi:dTDP-4-amino-4,6-dideoxygalactose transaminase
LGRIGAFSFCQDKIMTTGGEGGMLVTNDSRLWERAWAYKDHGKSHDAVFNREHAPGFRWLHESFGTNLRMTEMQAAIGRRQLAKLPTWLSARRRHAALLEAQLDDLAGLVLRHEPANHHNAYYKFYVFVDPARLAPDWNRQRIIAAVNAEGIPCAEGSCSEMYLEKAFVDAGLAPEKRLPAARELGETSLVFMVHPTMKERDVLDSAAALRKVMAVAVRD